MDKFAKSLNKRALELDEEVSKDDDRPNKKVKSGLIYSPLGYKLTSQQSQALVFKFHSIQNKFYQVNKCLKQAKSNLKKLKDSPPSHKQNENERQKELLD